MTGHPDCWGYGKNINWISIWFRTTYGSGTNQFSGFCFVCCLVKRSELWRSDCREKLDLDALHCCVWMYVVGNKGSIIVKWMRCLISGIISWVNNYNIILIKTCEIEGCRVWTVCTDRTEAKSFINKLEYFRKVNLKFLSGFLLFLKFLFVFWFRAEGNTQFTHLKFSLWWLKIVFTTEMFCFCPVVANAVTSKGCNKAFFDIDSKVCQYQRTIFISSNFWELCSCNFSIEFCSITKIICVYKILS